MSRFLPPHFFVGKKLSLPSHFRRFFENGFLLVVCRGYSSIGEGERNKNGTSYTFSCMNDYLNMSLSTLGWPDVRTQNDDRLCPQQRLRFKRQSSFKIAETRESSESFQKKRRYGSETESSSILCAVLRQQIALLSEREACYVRIHVFRHV